MEGASVPACSLFISIVPSDWNTVPLKHTRVDQSKRDTHTQKFFFFFSMGLDKTLCMSKTNSHCKERFLRNIYRSRNSFWVMRRLLISLFVSRWRVKIKARSEIAPHSKCVWLCQYCNLFFFLNGCRLSSCYRIFSPTAFRPPFCCYVLSGAFIRRALRRFISHPQIGSTQRLYKFHRASI